MSRYRDLNSSSETQQQQQQRAGRQAATLASSSSAPRTPATATSSSPSSISPRGIGQGSASSARSLGGGVGGMSGGGGDLSQSSTFGDEDPAPTVGARLTGNGIYESMSTDPNRIHLHSTLKKTSSIGGLYANEPADTTTTTTGPGGQPLSFETFKSALESRMNGLTANQQSLADETTLTIEEDGGTSGGKKSNLSKSLLYKKVTNGKYVRFETVVRNKLYDTETGRIKGTFFTYLNYLKEVKTKSNIC